MAYSGLGHLVSSDLFKLMPGNFDQTEKFTVDGLGGVMDEVTVDNSGITRPCTIRSFEFGQLKSTVADTVVPPGGRVEGPYPKFMFQTFDPAGNVVTKSVEESYRVSHDTLSVTTRSGSRSYYGADDRLRYVQVQRWHYTPENQVVPSSRSGVWEEYRYDALGRRVALAAIKEGLCAGGPTDCRSYHDQFVWAGDQLIGERRDTTEVGTGSSDHYGIVVYTHASGIDQPAGR